jgi:hypothetical protein
LPEALPVQETQACLLPAGVRKYEKKNRFIFLCAFGFNILKFFIFIPDYLRVNFIPRSVFLCADWIPLRK